LHVICIKEPGLFTTVQDLGRKGLRQFGVPVCGAVDTNCLQAANILVGNPPGEGALELTMAGPEVEFDSFSVIGVTGADMDPRINGRPLPMWQAVAVHPGDRLQFGWAKNGCRAYLAVAGGIDVPRIMGSKSTYIRGRIGGFKGRALLRGDCLPVGVSFTALEVALNRRIPSIHIPELKTPWAVRVVLGPQTEYFTEDGLHTFLSQEYRVTKDADRMGCRLEGQSIGHVAGADIISDAVLPGSIQVPGNGCPIVMLGDCNTTGGYAKIATVIHTDLWKIAQARPGDIVRFAAVSLEEAQKVYLDTGNIFNYLTSCLGTQIPSGNNGGDTAGVRGLSDLSGLTELLVTSGVPGIDLENGGPRQIPPVAVQPPRGSPDDMVFVTAPFAGVYFRSPSPGAQPYVQTGEVIEEGRTIGLLEFMNLTLELDAGTGGEIIDILAEDRQLVGSGQRIVVIRRME